MEIRKIIDMTQQLTVTEKLEVKSAWNFLFPKRKLKVTNNQVPCPLNCRSTAKSVCASCPWLLAMDDETVPSTLYCQPPTQKH